MAIGVNKDSKLPRLKSANARLDAAMGRLEKALAVQNTGAGDSEMATLRAENEKLSGLNKISGERLDGAINRLKAVLKEA